MGVAVFIAAFPLRILNPRYIDWLRTGDRAAGTLGWLYFRNEPWRFPLGSIHGMLGSIPTTVGYTDSIPLAAILFKLFAPWLPDPFQYFGIWLFACYALQGLFAFKLLRALNLRLRDTLLGTLLFVTAPVLLFRWPHLALSAHWIVLAAIYLYVRERSTPRIPAAWAALVIGAVWIQPYVAAMVFGMAIAAACGEIIPPRPEGWLVSVLARLATLVVALLSAFGVLGYLAMGGGSAWGFGYYNTDLLAAINPFRYSLILPELTTAPGGYEGYAYLGLGTLVLLAFVGVELVRHRNVFKPDWRRWSPLIIAVVLMLVYALGSPLTLDGHPLFRVRYVYRLLAPLTGVFRTNGRFVWPFYYLLVTAAIVIAVRLLGGKRATLLLACVAAVQLIDLSPAPKLVREGLRTSQMPRLDGPAWAGLGQSYAAIELVPAYFFNSPGCGPESRPDDYNSPLSFLAVRERMRFNSGYVSRPPTAGIHAACVAAADSVRRGIFDPRTVYVPRADELPRLEAAPGLICGPADGYTFCVERARQTPLRDYLLQSSDKQ